MKMKLGFATFLATTFLAGTALGADAIDPRFKDYQSTSGVSGTLKSIGSDTLNNLMTLWAEDFKKIYPGVKIEIEGKGSSTAPPAMIAGTAQFGPMSRAMRPAEKDQFEAKYGYKPTEVRVAVDALAVFVHKDNPVKCLSLGQLDGIFSVTRNTGSPDLKTWDQLGVTGEYAGKTISLFGRNSASGTYGYFKEVALANGDTPTKRGARHGVEVTLGPAAQLVEGHVGPSAPAPALDQRVRAIAVPYCEARLGAQARHRCQCALIETGAGKDPPRWRR